jgi:hypothetical protein
VDTDAAVLEGGPMSRRAVGSADKPGASSPITPDGRYIVVRGRLWRASNPSLSPERRVALVSALMAARRAVHHARQADDPVAEAAAHAAVDSAKIALGERGAPWWDDGAPDLNRHMVRTTPYASWFEALAARVPCP